MGLREHMFSFCSYHAPTPLSLTTFCGTGPKGISLLDNFNFVLAERLFAPHYFNDSPLFKRAGEQTIRLSRLPLESEEACLRNLPPVIDAFMRRCKHGEDWAAFDAFLFSLTTAQTAASLALAKHLKGELPSTPIVFGGTSCAGDMGVTLMEVAPEIDVLVHSEAENCLGPLVDALNGSVSFSTVPGISYRDRGTIVSTEPAPLFETNREATPLNFSSYFDRLSCHPSLRDVPPLDPFRDEPWVLVRGEVPLHFLRPQRDYQVLRTARVWVDRYARSLRTRLWVHAVLRG